MFKYENIKRAGIKYPQLVFKCLKVKYIGVQNDNQEGDQCWKIKTSKQNHCSKTEKTKVISLQQLKI